MSTGEYTPEDEDRDDAEIAVERPGPFPGPSVELRIEKEAHDPVNHPPHYVSHPSGVECITVVEHFNFNRGNAIKYIWRAGEKGDEIEDLKKGRWYLDREIARLESGLGR